MINISNIKITGRLNGTTLGSAESYWVASTTNSTTFRAQDVTVDTDGGVYIPSTSASVVLKLNSDGSLAWRKTSTIISGQFFKTVYNNGLYAIGRGGSGYAKKYMLKINQDGTLNQKYYYPFDYPSSEEINGAFLDGNGNIYTVGTIDRGGFGSDGIIMKINSAGTILWQKAFYRNSTSTESSHSGVAIGNYIYCSTASFADMGTVITKFTDNGDVVWHRRIPMVSASSMSTDGSSIYYGTIDGTGKPYIAKLNQDGVIVWQRTVNLSTSLVAVESDTDGNSYMAMISSTGSTTSNDIIVFKFDTNGTVVWQKRISTANSDTSPSLTIKDNSVYLSFMSGTTVSVIIKMPNDGTTTGSYGPTTFSDTSFSVANASSETSATSILVGATLFANGITNIILSDATTEIATTVIG